MGLRSWIGSKFQQAVVVPEPEIPAPAEPLTATAPLEIGRTLTSWIYSGKTTSVWAVLNNDMRMVFGTERVLKKFCDGIAKDAGRETGVISERVALATGVSIYIRTALFSKTVEPMVIEWTFDKAGSVHGLTISPEKSPAKSRYVDYQTKTPLCLPFTGEWLVFWGGRSVADNYHATVRDQRFAMDFCMMRDGATHSGNGDRNEDYYCFGKPILAPGDGLVVAVENARPDQRPGDMNRWYPLGNHVIIDHGNAEFSFLAHLERGSVSVTQGARVRAGEQIGRCGNSGHSSEPHLHYHLQDNSTFAKGDGLTAQFLRFEADGRFLERGEVERGQMVRPPRSAD